MPGKFHLFLFCILALVNVLFKVICCERRSESVYQYFLYAASLNWIVLEIKVKNVNDDKPNHMVRVKVCLGIFGSCPVYLRE